MLKWCFPIELQFGFKFKFCCHVSLKSRVMKQFSASVKARTDAMSFRARVRTDALLMGGFMNAVLFVLYIMWMAQGKVLFSLLEFQAIE